MKGISLACITCDHKTEVYLKKYLKVFENVKYFLKEFKLQILRKMYLNTFKYKCI